MQPIKKKLQIVTGLSIAIGWLVIISLSLPVTAKESSYAFNLEYNTNNQQVFIVDDNNFNEIISYHNQGYGFAPAANKRDDKIIPSVLPAVTYQK